jgi:hypothetical protein
VTKIFIIRYVYFGLLMKERSRGTYGHQKSFGFPDPAPPSLNSNPMPPETSPLKGRGVAGSGNPKDF